MKQDKIMITAADLSRLRRLIDVGKRFASRDADHIDALEHELDRAIIKDGAVPMDVVALGSSVRIRDLDSGKELQYEIVLPKDANAEENRISVLAPIGTGLLGYRVGTTVEWVVPSGLRRFEILEVHHQPESTTVAA